MERTAIGSIGNILVLNENDCYLEAKPYDFEYLYSREHKDFVFLVWEDCEILWSITKSKLIRELPNEFDSFNSTPYIFFRAITLFYNHQRLNA